MWVMEGGVRIGVVADRHARGGHDLQETTWNVS